MIDGLVTVVIPIYNVEKYLERCIRSVVDQTYKNIEIILVDDESPDRCPEICEQWASLDSRIRVIHKKNNGLGMARNSGIEIANGEYICFFDSDDYIDSNLIEQAYKKAHDYDAPMVIWGYKCIDSRGKIANEHVPIGNQDVFEDDDIENVLLLNMIDPKPKDKMVGSVSMSAWSKMYSMRIIQETGWRFCSEREFISEDLYSNLDFFSNIDKAVIIRKALYNYCYNEASLTKSYRKDMSKKAERCYNSMLCKCVNYNYDIEICKRLGFWYFGAMMGIGKCIINSDMKIHEQLHELKLILQEYNFSKVMSELSFKDEGVPRQLVHWMVKKQYYILWFLSMKGQNIVKCFK